MELYQSGNGFIPEHEPGLAPGVKLLVPHQVRPVEADQVGLNALRPLYYDLDARLKLNECQN